MPICYDTTTITGHRPGQLCSVFPTSNAAVSSVQDLYDFICTGPLIKKLGLTPEMVASTMDQWLECGLHLCRLFGMNELNLTTAQKARLYRYYIPIYLWCEDQILDHRSKFRDGDEITPLVIGVSAPQGCGKTTLVFALHYLFRVTGRNSATLSIDDFYLTAEDQAKLQTENPGNSLLELRGNAGTHDLPFSIDTLTGLRKLAKQGMKMKLPRYDKSAFGGRGDRANPSTWPEVEGPLEVILFEGWMLGFRPLPNEVVKAIDPQLEVVNKCLEAYYDAWDKFIESWLIIKIKDPSCVFQWRLQVCYTPRQKGNKLKKHPIMNENLIIVILIIEALSHLSSISFAEIAMREECKPGMSDEEVLDFVSRYLPAYKAYLPILYSEGPKSSDPEKLLLVEIDEGRNPIISS